MPTDRKRSRAKKRIIIIHDNLDATLYSTNNRGSHQYMLAKMTTTESYLMARVLPRLGFKVEVFDLSANAQKVA